MLERLIVAYIFGGITFLPLLVLGFWTVARFNQRTTKPPRPRIRTGAPSPDTTAEAEVRGWLRYSSKYVNFREAGEEDDARKTLQKLASGSISASKALGRLQKYWAVVRGGQLQLYENQDESRIVDVLALSDFVVMLWPPALQEFELFYRKYPIALVSRSEFPLDDDSRPPLEAFWFYCENPVIKEDIYLGMIRESRTVGAKADPSLGLWDPLTAARPLCATRSENRELQSRIWTTSEPRGTQWLNALIGRIFLGVKGSELVENYLRKKFAYKLRSISEGSSIISEIQVLNIDCGASSPYVKAVNLRELTPDGNLLIAVDIEYNGGFRVNLGTRVSLWAAEIPIELAGTLASLEGTLILRVKPPPTSRVWYAFEKMPKLNLLLDPVVYDTQISYGVVTSFIKNRIIESIRETMVMPFMDDIAFYDTSISSYRGGIWDEPDDSTPRPQTSRAGTKEPSSTQLGTLQRRASSVSSVSQLPPPSPPVMATSASPVPVSPEYNSTLRRVSQWVRRKTSTQSLRPAPSGSPEKHADRLDRPLPAPPSVTTQTSHSTARLSPRPAVRRKPVVLSEEYESPTRQNSTRHRVKRRPVPGSPSTLENSLSQVSEPVASAPNLSTTSPGRSSSTQSHSYVASAPQFALPMSSTASSYSQDRASTSDDIFDNDTSVVSSRRVLPAQSLRPSHPSAPSLPKPQTVADATSTSVTAPVEPHNWRGSLEDESHHLRRTVSRSCGGSSASSVISDVPSDVPSLPPRRRKYVVLANVAPEPSD